MKSTPQPQATPLDVWAVGDVQGCCDALDQLLHHPAVSDPDRHSAVPKDAREPHRPRFWFAGDLVNRGPASLATLQRVRALGDRAITVLGNHDLHLLAVAAGIRPARRDDTVDDILRASDADDWIDWLRHRPLAHLEQGHLLVHAGVLPQWSAAKTRALAAEVETVLQGPNWRQFLAEMYGNEPASWHDQLRGTARWRVIVNALTRLRFCTPDGHMEFATKDQAGKAPLGYLPWFDVPDRHTRDVTVVFGHWSTLGLRNERGLVALDTGCIWGGHLSAIHLGNRRLVSVACAGLPGVRQPG